MDVSEVTRCLEQANARRAELWRDADTNCFRLCNGSYEGLPGVHIERLGEVAAVDVTQPEPAWLDTLKVATARAYPSLHVVLRPRGQAGYFADEVTSARPIFTVSEQALHFEVSVVRPYNVGLYLDARPVRSWLRENSEGRRILNLFSFTGSLGVAALAGKARGVVHVDQQQAVLAWARRNHALNGQTVDDRSFMRADVFQHLRKKGAQRLRFDGIIVDPPPDTDRVLQATRGASRAAAVANLVYPMLEQGAWMLCLFHHDTRSDAELEHEITFDKQLAVVWRASSGLDFPDHGANRLRIVAFSRTG